MNIGIMVVLVLELSRVTQIPGTTPGNEGSQSRSKISPIRAPFPTTLSRKARKTAGFQPRGKCALNSPQLPKHERKRPHRMATKGPEIEVKTATQFTPSGPHIPNRNANVRVVFFRERTLQKDEGKNGKNRCTYSDRGLKIQN